MLFTVFNVNFLPATRLIVSSSGVKFAASIVATSSATVPAVKFAGTARSSSSSVCGRNRKSGNRPVIDVVGVVRAADADW
jgi:hypothetical protein